MEHVNLLLPYGSSYRLRPVKPGGIIPFRGIKTSIIPASSLCGFTHGSKHSLIARWPVADLRYVREIKEKFGEIWTKSSSNQQQAKSDNKVNSSYNKQPKTRSRTRDLRSKPSASMRKTELLQLKVEEKEEK